MSDHGIKPSDIPASKSATVTQGQIDSVVAAVRRLCGWHVWPEREETLTVDSLGDPVVFLPTKRLVEVLAVRIDGDSVPHEAFSWSSDGMLEVHSARPGFRRIAVEVVHGFSDASDLRGVCVSMAARDSAPSQAYSVGSISVGAPGAAMPQSTEWRIVDLYKLEPPP